MSRVISGLALVLAPMLASAADVPLNEKNTTINFIGTKPGGMHNGGFKAFSGNASFQNNDPSTLKIALDIDMNSLYADDPKLTDHLKSPDFFGVKSNPKSKFVTTNIEKAGSDYKVTGQLTMVGQTKPVTFPAQIAVGDNGLSFTSTFTIDRSKWGMNWGQGKVDNPVKIMVKVSAK